VQRKSIKLIILALLFSISLSACQPGADAQDTQGNDIRIADYHGKWVFLNYWAKWCKPCLTELPELNALHHAHADKLVVLGVNFDGLSDAEIQQFATSLRLDFPMLSQFPINQWGVNDISSLPITFILNPDGKLTKTLYGPQTQQSLLKAMEQP
jgi:peroxiredoxin